MTVVSGYTDEQEENRTGLRLIGQFEGCFLCFHTKITFFFFWSKRQQKLSEKLSKH